MPALPSYFDDFLKSIRLQADLREELQEAHRELTERLDKDQLLKPVLVETFLQGSYKRSTIVDPEDGDMADVDVVVVTGLDERAHPEPSSAMDLFVPFLNDNYAGKWEPQDRSFGIEQGGVWMDMVITSAPSEAVKRVLAFKAVRSRMTLEEDPEFKIRGAWTEPQFRTAPHNWRVVMEAEGQPLGDWSEDPLRIPDRTRKCWEPTHPLAQIDWTAEKSRQCNGHFLGVVRALKWWRRRNPTPKYPKGYPLEALVGDACPDGITSVADGVVRTLEVLDSKWAGHKAAGRTPYIKDHGVDQDVLGRISPEEFGQFHALVGPASRTARAALDAEDKYVSVELWQKLFGGRFPDAPDSGGSGGDGPRGGFTPRREVGTVGGGRFG